MRPAPFNYHKATDLTHALKLLADFGEEGRPLAGGQSLVPMMNLRLARPGNLVDINSLPFTKVERRGDVLHLGSLVRHSQYFGEPLIAQYFPAFLEAVHWLGHPTVRNRGTLGGSISHADPTAELPAMCLLYDAVIVAQSMGGERRIAAADFFLGAYVTALEPGELVVAVEFPLPSHSCSGAFEELGERRGDFAIASVGASISYEGGRIRKAAIVCGGARLTPIRATEIENSLAGRPLEQPNSAELAQHFASGLEPVSDIAGTADYRRYLIGELTRRAIDRACRKALEAA